MEGLPKDFRHKAQWSLVLLCETALPILWTWEKAAQKWHPCNILLDPSDSFSNKVVGDEVERSGCPGLVSRCSVVLHVQYIQSRRACCTVLTPFQDKGLDIVGSHVKCCMQNIHTEEIFEMPVSD